jgi:exonuclease III
MFWEWINPEGRSGGLLIGANKESVEVLDYKEGKRCQHLVFKSRGDDFKWSICNVYGPVQVELKPEFLRELMEMILSAENPIIVGGDFNLVRDASEKSTGNVNASLVNLFNQFVSDTSLREMHHHRGTYTWTNKQSSPIMAALDRVFMSAD